MDSMSCSVSLTISCLRGSWAEPLLFLMALPQSSISWAESKVCVCPADVSPSEALRKVIVGITLHVGEATALAKFATCVRSCVLLGFPLLLTPGDLTERTKGNGRESEA
uniref:Putative secreted protein n=1 Tax=Ixodes ricinus TaxID=34613 RepID=A0A6B0UAF6_IXORI